ncbi:MAG: hypothetical protein ACI9NC_003435, partial [Verrucomicrobiales bacterium]
LVAQRVKETRAMVQFLPCGTSAIDYHRNMSVFSSVRYQLVGAALIILGFSSCVSVSRNHSTKFRAIGSDTRQLGNTTLKIGHGAGELTESRELSILPPLIFEDLHHDGDGGSRFFYVNFSDETKRAKEAIVHSAKMEFRGQCYLLKFWNNEEKSGASFRFSETLNPNKRILFIMAGTGSIPSDRREGEVLTARLDIEICSDGDVVIRREFAFEFVWDSRETESFKLVIPRA